MADAAPKKKAKIVKAEGQDFKGFRLVELSPSETLVRCLGPNGAGKSRVLQLILGTLDPKQVEGATVSYGADKSRQKVTLALPSGATLEIERTVKAGGGTQVVVKRIDDEGVSRHNAKDVIPRLLGPLQDLRQLPLDTPAQEREFADRLLGAAGVDLAGLDAAIDRAAEERRTANAALQSIEARLAAAPEAPATPIERVDVAAVSRQLEDARAADGRRAEALDEIQTMERDRQSAQFKREEAERNIADLERRIAEWRDAAQESASTVASIEDSIEKARANLPEAPDEAARAELMAKIEAADETNRRADAQARRAELVTEHDDAVRDAEAATQALGKARAAKAQALKDAPMPVDGLAVTDSGGLTFEGTGLHELSEGQRMVVKVAVALETMGSLGAIFCDRGESLDEANEARIRSMCDAAGVDLYLTQTVRRGEGLVIEGADFRHESA